MTIAAAIALAAATQTVADLRWNRRVLIVASPSADDRALEAQRRALAGWRRGAADRDVTVVEVVADTVSASRDTAADLRRRFRLAPDAFAVVLIGKDGHVALRSAAPVVADMLQRTIDAMPMRRAGLR